MPRGGRYSIADFDLSGARSCALPTIPSTRGTMRGGIGPSSPNPAVEKLEKSGNHWARKKEDDSELERKVKQMKSLLNKLAIDNLRRSRRRFSISNSKPLKNAKR